MASVLYLSTNIVPRDLAIDHCNYTPWTECKTYLQHSLIFKKCDDRSLPKYLGSPEKSDTAKIRAREKYVANP